MLVLVILQGSIGYGWMGGFFGIMDFVLGCYFFLFINSWLVLVVFMYK